jgi:acyl-CoA synthetase (AMP-forming)/AMP-acid ligase II
MEMEKMTISLPNVFNVAAHFLEKNLTPSQRDRVAFYERDRVYTYAQVHTWVQRMAGWLSELGLEREQRIAILLPDNSEFVFAFWGAIWMGAVPEGVTSTPRTHTHSRL